ncbi:MAG: DUF1656 domain-containing protein [Marinobacter sp.]|uniref:DUF1656 domain-containing protein n=1 Tax=Marinobacter sp. TaxID=50741 RepID=UPI001B68DC02|nr:DUF1656 domain-containing protein [Marinobacter sp.]MBQ0748035.1 DUF1656 domain-containing protein [Marinobacter sp.]MBQ0815900.1 DUF1656 domain-containing protein [Marinobacter sp.]|tara:strand:+ start:1306 stop:1506 length:201 start_codon:yes stop_codon:yes gene_type:complete
MLHEMSVGGMLFSPLVVLVPLAFILAAATRLVLHHLELRRYIWKEAWFDVAMFVCYLAAIVYLFGN